MFYLFDHLMSSSFLPLFYSMFAPSSVLVNKKKKDNHRERKLSRRSQKFPLLFVGLENGEIHIRSQEKKEDFGWLPKNWTRVSNSTFVFLHFFLF